MKKPECLAANFPFWTALKAVTVDGNYLVTGYNDTILRVHKVDGVNKCLEEVMSVEFNGLILDFAISPNEKYLAVADVDNNISIYGINYDKETLEFITDEEIENPIVLIDFAPNDDQVLKILQLNNYATVLEINYLNREMFPIFSNDLPGPFVASIFDRMTKCIIVDREEIELNQLECFNTDIDPLKLNRLLELQQKLKYELNERLKQEN